MQGRFKLTAQLQPWRLGEREREEKDRQEEEKFNRDEPHTMGKGWDATSK